MEKFDVREFTEEFDLERFKAGDPCLILGSSKAFRTFKEEVDGRLYSNESPHIMAFVDEKPGLDRLRMRPAVPKVDDGWIKVVDGECPEIEANEHYDIHSRDGIIFTNIRGSYIKWNGYGWNSNGGDIVAIRRIKQEPNQETRTRNSRNECTFEGHAQENKSPEPSINHAKLMRDAIDGWGALLGARTGEVVTVEREMFAALRKGHK